MNQARFPKKREDGSVCVAARFTFDARSTVDAAQAEVKNWTAQRKAEGTDLGNDLATEPHVVVRDQRTLDVVFEGRAGSVRWKDWLVGVSKDISATVPSLAFVCFYDLVADIAHPASRMRD